MRIADCILPAVAAAVALALAADSAAAQSFLQTLFGFGGPPAGAAAPPPSPVVRLPLPPVSSGPMTSRPPGFSPRRAPGQEVGQGETDGEPSPPAGWTGKYRTVCVRACDGYYFPLSNSAGRARFMRDAAQCRASCGEDARLFYMPSGSDNVATMIDLGGRAYLRHPNAFKYRKSLIDGCSCRPMPWSEAEMARHRRYAEAESRRTEAHAALPAGVKLPQVAAVVAAAAPGDPSNSSVGRVAATSASAQPQPESEVAASTTEHAALDTDATPGASGSDPSVAARGQRGVTAPPTPQALQPATPPRARAAARPVRVEAKLSVSSGSAGGLFGGWGAAPSKYTWPGDAPRR